MIKEGKVPTDTRVALTPQQCKWIKENYPSVDVKVQSCANRCYSDSEYKRAGIEVVQDVADCDILLGIKEVPKHELVAEKCYMFFSHTKKMQPYNQAMLHEIIKKKITLIDYECLEHEDGARVIGFGFFAGVVGAHNGIMAYGNRTGDFKLGRVGDVKNFKELIHTYFGLKLPNIKIAVTGSGRVAHGILEIMNLLGIHEAEEQEYLEKESFSYPVYVHLKPADLYRHKINGDYTRADFHENPQNYDCLFPRFMQQTDILMNGIYWDKDIPRLFEKEAIQAQGFRMNTIADITDDLNGSVPINLGDSTIEDPVYGVDKNSFEKTKPYLPGSVDIMAVGNLPNELPRDASAYFGEQMIKYVLEDLLTGNSRLIHHATIIDKGELNEPYEYMREYATVS